MFSARSLILGVAGAYALSRAMPSTLYGASAMNASVDREVVANGQVHEDASMTRPSGFAPGALG